MTDERLQREHAEALVNATPTLQTHRLSAEALVTATPTIQSHREYVEVLVPRFFRWWDGTNYQNADLLGWWDGSVIRPVSVQGWWDGSTIKPVEVPSIIYIPPPSFDAKVLAKVPLTYWQLDEAVGSTSFVDSAGTGSSHPAMAQVGAVTAGQASLLSTGVGASVTFPSSGTNYLLASYGTWADSTQFTYLALIRPTTLQSAFIFGQDDLSGADTYRKACMNTNAAGDFLAQFTTTGSSFLTYTFRSAAFAINTTYLAVITFDGTTVKGYINGTLCSGTGTPGAGVRNSVAPFSIGRSAVTINAGGFWNFPGRISRCAYWGTALSAADIADFAASM